MTTGTWFLLLSLIDCAVYLPALHLSAPLNSSHFYLNANCRGLRVPIRELIYTNASARLHGAPGLAPLAATFHPALLPRPLIPHQLTFWQMKTDHCALFVIDSRLEIISFDRLNVRLILMRFWTPYVAYGYIPL